MRIVNPSILLVCTVGLLGCDSASPTVDVSTDSALDVGQQDGTVVDSRIDSGAADSSNDNGASADASGTDAMFTHDGSAVDGAVRDSAREVATGDGGFNCDAQDARGEGSCRELLG